MYFFLFWQEVVFMRNTILRTFATIRKNEKRFQRLEFNVTVCVG